LIEARGLTKRFGERIAVDGVDLDVPEGVCFGFLGPNGAGKTTLIRLMLGLARPTAGAVQIGGVDVTADPRAALRQVGAIVEEPRFHGHLTGKQNLLAHAALLEDPAAAADRVDTLIARVGLEGRGTDKVKGYSMGMRQRLGVARALLGDPRLLVLDEPTNGLDAEGMAGFRGLIRFMVEEEGRTVFLSSHLLDEMQKLCDGVAIVENGRVVMQSTVKALLADETALLHLDVDDPVRAIAALERGGFVADNGAQGLRVAGVDGREDAIAIVRLLVEAGVGVAEARRSTGSLEQRYFALTSSDPAEGVA
jgi:ABC-2 type transport system ATP-binding protein